MSVTDIVSVRLSRSVHVAAYHATHKVCGGVMMSCSTPLWQRVALRPAWSIGRLKQAVSVGVANTSLDLECLLYRKIRKEL